MVRVTRVARNALPGGEDHWRSGRRAHLALRPTSDRVRREGGTARAARRVAAALAEHPEVAYAYWDGGLARLVVAAREEAVMDRVLEKATALAERHGLGPSDDGDDAVEDFTHPGDPAGVRTAAAALLADAVGTGAALTAYALRLPPSPRFVTAAVTLLRENPGFRSKLRDRYGRSRTDLLLAVANAAAHGAGQTPTSLLLDATLRAFQLAETVARAAAFDTVHDRLCVPGRSAAAPDVCPRPPLRSTPAHEYANHAETGSVLGAVATLLVKHDGAEAAEAVLAGSPKAARYGPAAFNAVLGCALARTGVLVRDPERVRRLETARTLVLHPSALCTDGGSGDENAAADPWTEAVLDAARHAGLRVVVVDHPALEDFTALADRVVHDRPLPDVVASLREHGGVVTVARPGPADDTDILSGLLGSDVAVALADRDAAVVWGADVVAPGGLADVWRLLASVPAARTVGRRSQTLARSGAALSGLLVAIGESRRGRRAPVPGLRHVPVDISAAFALVSGARAAIGVAVTPAPHPRARVAWHALRPSDVRSRLRRRTEGEPSVLEQATTRVHRAADAAGSVPVLAPARWSVQLARAVRGELDDPLTPVLAVGSAASAILGSAVDALLVVGALDLNALVGGLQRLRAERALAGLLAEQKQKARLAPDESQDKEQSLRTVDAAKLIPGQIIELKGDDVVPADARLLWEDGLEVDESALTGESLPVDKQTAPRALWHSVADAIAILIGGNAGEVGFGIIGTLLAGSAPLSTRQMLLVNLFTDLFPAMAVSVTAHKDRSDEEPHDDKPLGTSLLGAPLMEQIRHRALTTTLGAVAAWLIGRFTPGSARRSTTMALCAVVGTQLAQTLADRRDSPLVRATSLGSAAALVALVQTPGVSRLFGCTPLGPVAWAGVAAAIAMAVAGQRALPQLDETVRRLSH